MSERAKKFIWGIAGGLAAIFLVARYFAGMLQTAFTGFGGTFNPIKMVQCSRVYGFPKGSFWVIFIILSLTTTICAVRFFLEEREMDVLGRRFRQPKKRQTYGAAHFESPNQYKEIARITTAEKAIGTIIGQLPETNDGKQVISMRTDNTRMNSHIAIVGPSGSGKTHTFSKNYCYQTAKRRDSIVITDPDGGLYRDMAGFFINQGYVVKCINLKDVSKSNGWNCLKTLEGCGDINTKASVFAQTIINNVDDGEAAEGIYKKGPMQLLKALILRVFLGEDYLPEEKNIRTVYDLLCQENATEFLDQLFCATGQKNESAYLKPWRIFVNGSANLRGNIFTNLGTDLQLLQSEEISRVLSTDDMDFALLGERPCAYFCQFPDYHGAFKFVVSLFFSMLFITLIEKADSQPTGKLSVPVNFLLDEFPSIGILPDWEKKMATIRKRNINVAMIFQDITQLQNNYDRTWVTLMSNCSTWILLGINDRETAKIISERIGQTTTEAQTEQRPAYEPFINLGLRNRSVGEGRRDLLSVSELHEMDIDNGIILFQNHHPVYFKKFPHEQHPYARFLCEDPFGPMPPLSNKMARAERQRKEEKFLEEYEQNHCKDQRLTEADLDKEEQEQSFHGIVKRAAAKFIEKIKKNAPEENEAQEYDFIFEEDSFEIVRGEDESMMPDMQDGQLGPLRICAIGDFGEAIEETPLGETFSDTAMTTQAFAQESPQIIDDPIRFAMAGEPIERPDLRDPNLKRRAPANLGNFVHLRSKDISGEELDIISKEERTMKKSGSALPENRMPRK